ncbi:MAG: ankyrin repeat domain-containing protein [Synergistaceae bacterium]|jgi:ankyrin repeat protein|nr:ankyrin repeat domain-containing protein [Synergistaceae bacterium]
MLYTHTFFRKVAVLTLLLPVLLALGNTGAVAAALDAAELERLCVSGTARELELAFDTAGEEITSGDDVPANFLFTSGNRPLHVAAEYASDPGVIAVLARRGGSLSAEGLERLTPLMVAAAYNPNVKVTEALIDAGAEVNSADRQGRTPLYLASASNESPEAAAALLRRGAQPNIRDRNGRTPLWVAAARSNIAVVQLLLDAGAKVDEPNNEGVTPLLAASEKPNAAVLRLLVEAGADAGVRGKNRYTPLMSAVAAGADLASIRALLDRRADPSAEDDQNRSAIHLWASRQDAAPDVLEALAGAGASPNAMDSSLATPLIEACKQKNTAAVKALLKAGSKTGLRDRNGWTALMHAASKGAPEEIYTLLKAAGADMNECTHQGSTALMLALESKVRPEGLRALLRQGADPNRRAHDTISPLMAAVAASDAEAAGALLEGGANPDLATWDGLTPLMLAAQRVRDPEFFKHLVKAGATLDQKSAQDTTALMVAAASSNVPAVETLLALSADVTARDFDGSVALSHAAQAEEEDQDTLKIVELLLAAGSDPNAPDARGTTPLMYAAAGGKSETARRLLAAGAKRDATDAVGWTALHHAAIAKNGAGFAQLLLGKEEAASETSAGLMNADLADNGGTTPLMVAASRNNADMVLLLLEAGADPLRPDKTGRSTRDYALMKSATAAIRVVESFIQGPRGKFPDTNFLDTSVK